MKKFLYTIAVLLSASCSSGRNAGTNVDTPPMGWNSFDSYGVYLHEKAAMENLEAFAEKLKPYGYEYFVIDAGWFGEFELKEGTLYSKEIHAKRLNLNEYGLLQPSRTYFPNGFRAIIDRCHELGLKFGLHLMRGIPKQAVEENLPIKGTRYRAGDIADTVNVCNWCPQNYGVDMTKPGAQEYYNSLIGQMAEWGVDFLKYDDIVPYPDEVQAVVNAIKQCGRPIVLSLSPGSLVHEDAVGIYAQADMMRVTRDIWDDQEGIDQCFEAWRKWQGMDHEGLWIDMDMIPFGKLQLMAPKPKGLDGSESKSEVRKMIASGKLEDDALFSGKGWTRWSKLSRNQMKTFITMRSMAASPLMVGGDLPTMDEYSLSLLTDEDIIRCNQNGVMGKPVKEMDGIEIWKTDARDFDGGWIGIFNRGNEDSTVRLNIDDIGLDSKCEYAIYNVFEHKKADCLTFAVPGHGVTFLRYSRK